MKIGHDFVPAAVLILSWAAGGPVAAQPPVSQDQGGVLRAYAADVARLNRARQEKRIAGLCASACTLYLGVDKVCIEPTAQVWFHAAFRPGDAQPDRAGSLEMLSYYPLAVRRWAIRSAALEQTGWDPAHRLTGQQLIAMGVRQCPGP
ncbi:MAG: hypothetical protein JWM36_4201 [Hyphomicrobiales bacterium]|nr:hypothetical protein [Hyphomicrobiales bacterium]